MRQYKDSPAAMPGEEIAKPDTHERTYAFVELDNKLRVILGSDPQCDKAGAALCVNAGMCYERKDMPGLAHFLEHMLFTGTSKYPKEGEYHEFIQQNGGRANAYTACYITNYMFEIKPDMLEQALDRFSRFFWDSTLTRDCTEREINAVDSEFQAGFTSPWWRYVGIMNQSANPDHPWHVHCGSTKILLHEPKERGIDLYDEMMKFYSEYYSANGMTLCVIGKGSIPELEAMVREKFSPIVNKDLQLPLGVAVSDKPAFLPSDWNRLLLQAPVKDVKELTFSWVIPLQYPNWRIKPFSYISHLIGHEGKGSLCAVLKERGLISGCYMSDGAWLQGAFSLLNVEFELTEKGVNAVGEIGQLLFTYIGMLQKQEPQQRIFDEMSRLRRIQFKFGEDRRPFELATDIAGSLQQLPPAEVLAGKRLLYEYEPAAISSLLSMLTLEGVRVQHCAKVLLERCTDKDTSYDSPMAFLPLEADWRTDWAHALGMGRSAAENLAAAAASGLFLPEPNPFIPDDLSLKTLPAEPVPLPVRVPSATPPVAYIFHRQDDRFKQPKAKIVFRISSPLINKDVASYVKTELWANAVEESLKDFTYDAEIASLKYSLSLAHGALVLSVSGFHDKLNVLLEAVTAKMRSMTTIPENIFQIVSDAYGDTLKNTAFRSRPISQCSMFFSELATKGGSFLAATRHAAFQDMQLDQWDGFSEKLFEVCHVEAIGIGNVTQEDAQRLSGDLVAGLGLRTPLPAVPPRAEASLPPGSTLWTLDSADEDDPNHAVRTCIQIDEGVENEAMLSVLSTALSPKFFDVLRTQQQLGYIVQMGGAPSLRFSYLLAQVQTEFPPDYVRGRIDSFLEEHLAWIEDGLSEDEFQTCKRGVLSELHTKPKNLQEEAARYTRAFMLRTYDFERRQRLIAHLEQTATLESLRAFVREQVRPAPRLCVQVRKRVEKEDKPLPEDASVREDPEGLRRWEGLAETVRNFAGTAEWLSLNSEIS